MTLREKQSMFVRLGSRLIVEATARGYELTFGETKRSDEQAIINALGPEGREQVAQLVEAEFPDLAAALRNNGKARGIARSVHCDQLAVDLNLFCDGDYLESTAAHQPLGEWWEKQHTLCRWGGRFGDGNHYSLEHEGRR